MDQPTEDVETELVDLSKVTLGGLRASDPELLSRSVSRLVRQIAHPRLNLGGSGPPGRVD